MHFRTLKQKKVSDTRASAAPVKAACWHLLPLLPCHPLITTYAMFKYVNRNCVVPASLPCLLAICVVVIRVACRGIFLQHPVVPAPRPHCLSDAPPPAHQSKQVAMDQMGVWACFMMRLGLRLHLCDSQNSIQYSAMYTHNYATTSLSTLAGVVRCCNPTHGPCSIAPCAVCIFHLLF